MDLKTIRITAVLLIIASIMMISPAMSAEIIVELPENTLPVGETTTVPVVVTGVDNLETYTISIPNNIQDVELAINEPMTNELRSNNNINNRYSEDEICILWFDFSGSESITGDKVTLFYLDITPSNTITSTQPLTLNLMESVADSQVSTVTSYIGPEGNVQSDDDDYIPSESQTKTQTKTPEKKVTPIVNATQTKAPDTPKITQTTIDPDLYKTPETVESTAIPTASPLALFPCLIGFAGAVLLFRRHM